MAVRTVSLLWLLLLTGVAGAEPLSRDQIPEPLRPWTEWVLRGHEDELCPFLQGGEERRCAWPSRLAIEIGDRGGRFTQDFRVYRDTWVALPGDGIRWPLDLRVDGKSEGAVLRDGVPAVRLEKGKHTVAAAFQWDQAPELLAIPAETGLVALTIDGKPISTPNRDPQGQLWLRRRVAPESEEARLDVQVHRKVADEVPLTLVTRISLKVSGKSREVMLGKALPDGFVPLALSSPLPARLEPDGRLRAQVRPGVWTIEVTARHEGRVAELSLPAVDGIWDSQEIWAFEARNDLRLVEVEGVPSIDPQQTELPPEWRQFPAFAIEPGKIMRLVEKRRGDAEPVPDQLSLHRTWWLDFEGGGFTVHDRVSGTMNRGWRLEMSPPAVLGRAAIGGQDQFVTRRKGSQAAGVEVRETRVELDADSRIDGPPSRVSAVGWAHDFQQVSGQLNLPPGWRLLHASGVDDVSSAWLIDWTLLDLFLVVVTAMAAARVWGTAAGVLALTALVFSYHEPGAPGWIWLALLAAEALLLVLPHGRASRVVRGYRLVVAVFLVVTAIPFMIDQVRSGLFPALELPGRSTMVDAVSGVFGEAVTAPAPEMAPTLMAEPEERDDLEGEAQAPRRAPAKRMRGGVAALVKTEALDLPQYRTIDPNAAIPTGPGLPRWSWRSVSLGWRGPVEQGQEIHFWLVSPRVNLLLAILRVALVAALLLRALRPLASMRPAVPPARLAAGLVFFALLSPAAVRAADFPPDGLLQELQKRLLDRPDCFPSCASMPRLRIEATPGSLTARLEIDAAAETAVPLPGGSRGLALARVAVDGQGAEALSRGSDGVLWLAVSAGKHQVVMEGPLPDVDVVEIALPMRPNRIEATAEGWTVEGIREDGLAEENVRLVRERKAGGSRQALEPGALPPFVRVERVLHLGLSWSVETTVTRLSPLGAALTLEVPLLAGESVTTPDVRAANDKAFVGFGPSTSEIRWQSTLTEGPSIALEAPTGVAWTEVWRLDAGGLWHVEARGIPAIHSHGEGVVRAREWRPWPGEKVSIEITRPEGVPGQTLTIDSSVLQASPGIRATDSTLTIEVRSSRGGQRSLTLPEGAELLSVAINGIPQPIRQEKRAVTLPIAPGRQTLSLGWREGHGASRNIRSPEVGLGLASVNAETRIHMPLDRWTLFVGGGRLGPVVLFWGVLLVLALVSVVLGRVTLTPLRAHHWFLLGIGLTQGSIGEAGLVAGWLLALGWRRRSGATLAAGRFDLVQVLLAVWTVIALAGLFHAIQRGLLGLPEMEIVGNGSTAELLRWYHDRAGETLPRTWVVSVPMMVYRLTMLAWALWIAAALLSWLRWGWDCYSEGGLWKQWRLRRAATPEAPKV